MRLTVLLLIAGLGLLPAPVAIEPSTVELTPLGVITGDHPTTDALLRPDPYAWEPDTLI